MPEAQEIWKCTLDGRYEVKVVRTGQYSGLLTISENNETKFQEEVGLSYGAIFGPDSDDVELWESIAIDAVDTDKLKPNGMSNL